MTPGRGPLGALLESADSSLGEPSKNTPYHNLYIQGVALQCYLFFFSISKIDDELIRKEILKISF